MFLHKVIPMSTQIQQFKYFMRTEQSHGNIGSKELKSFLGSSLYCISAGTKDFSNYLSNVTFQNTTTLEQFINSTVGKFVSHIIVRFSIQLLLFFISFKCLFKKDNIFQLNNLNKLAFLSTLPLYSKITYITIV